MKMDLKLIKEMFVGVLGKITPQVFAVFFRPFAIFILSVSNIFVFWAGYCRRAGKQTSLMCHWALLILEAAFAQFLRQC